MSKRGVHLQSANREAAIQDTTVRHWKKRWLTPQPLQPDPPTTTLTTTHTSLGGGGYAPHAMEHVALAPLPFKVCRWISVDDLPAAAQLEREVARALHGSEQVGVTETQQRVEAETQDCAGVHREDLWLQHVSSVHVLRRQVEGTPVPEPPAAAEAVLLEPAQEADEQATERNMQQQEEVLQKDTDMVDASAAIADNTLVPVTQPAPEDEQGPSAIAAPVHSPVQRVDVAAGSELAEPAAAAAEIAAGLVPVADPIKPAEMDAVDASIPAATPIDDPAPIQEA